MMKLFRKIRRDDLSKGKKVKYLKYAIGEIVLVIIGILLAIQINNWNERRKDHLMEIEYLQELKTDLTKGSKKNSGSSFLTRFHRYIRSMAQG